jgi:hypothetical protein
MTKGDFNMRNFVASMAVLSLLIAVEASSAVYMWEDDHGVTGFTEDYGKIPQKYRKKARIVGQDQVDNAETRTVGEPQMVKPVKPPVTDAIEGTGSSAPVKTQIKKLFGGKDESYWLNEFGKQKAELRSYKDQLDAISARFANSGQMSRSEYKSLENTRKLLEEQEGAAKKRFESLTAEANRVGVPPDLR